MYNTESVQVLSTSLYVCAREVCTVALHLQQLSPPGESCCLHLINRITPHWSFVLSKQTHPVSLLSEDNVLRKILQNSLVSVNACGCIVHGPVCDQASHLEPTTDLVEDQRTRAEIRSASFPILERSVTMINEHSVTIRKAFTPPCASSEL